MNPIVLAEKKLNMFSNVEKPTSLSKSLIHFTTSNATSTNKMSLVEKRLLLGKANSCSDAVSSNSNGNCSFITPKQFVEMLSQHECKSVPIIDCRSQIDFSCERIHASFNINCRTKLMARKLISKRLEDVEPNLSVILNNFDFVILYDQSTDTRSEEKIRGLPINLVVLAARKSNKRVYIIQGGFDAVQSLYPHLIECAVEAPRNDGEQDCLSPSLDAIDKENFTMTEILPHIFVGNTHDAQNVDRLTEYGITHIINCTPDLPLFWGKKYKYMRVDAFDLPSQNIRKYFDKVFQFIEEALRTKTNNILVHCSAGISRSPTLVLAYMIKKYHMSLDDAFKNMRQLRQIVDPNVSFILQLREWEKKCLTTKETTDDNINTRSTSSTTYCGSTSKTKTDSKPRTDSVIIVK